MSILIKFLNMSIFNSAFSFSDMASSAQFMWSELSKRQKIYRFTK